MRVKQAYTSTLFKSLRTVVHASGTIWQCGAWVWQRHTHWPCCDSMFCDTLSNLQTSFAAGTPQDEATIDAMPLAQRAFHRSSASSGAPPPPVSHLPPHHHPTATREQEQSPQSQLPALLLGGSSHTQLAGGVAQGCLPPV